MNAFVLNRFLKASAAYLGLERAPKPLITPFGQN